jgi:hypothetical protein
MQRVFLGNFDFENELSLSSAGAASTGQTAQSEDLCWAWLATAEAGDCVLASGKIDTAELAPLEKLGLPIPRFVDQAFAAESSRDFELVPWGWTGSAQALAAASRWRSVAPPLEAVRQANRRSFRFELECKWNIGLSEATLARSLAELTAAVANLADRPLGWLLKAEFGMAGREAIRGRGTALDDRSRNWAQKRLAEGGCIVIEPVADRIAEAGIQIEIPSQGDPSLVGITPLVVDHSGVYRGSRFGRLGNELDVWQPAAEIALRVSAVVRNLGYFGPLGIDCMQYRDESGEIRMRPLQDLNARFTMGRLAIGFQRILPPGWCGSWIHFGARHLARRGPASWISEIASSHGAIAVPASPREIGGREAMHRAALIIAPSPDVLQHAESATFRGLDIRI